MTADSLRHDDGLLALSDRRIDPPAVDRPLFSAPGLFAGFPVAPRSVVAPFQYASLSWAIVLGILVWNRSPGPWTIVGASVIVTAGLYLARRDTRPGRR